MFNVLGQITFIQKSDSVSNFKYYVFDEILMKFDSINIPDSSYYNNNLNQFNNKNSCPVDDIQKMYFQKIKYDNNIYYLLIIITEKWRYFQETEYINETNYYNWKINDKFYNATITYKIPQDVNKAKCFLNTEFYIFDEKEYNKLFLINKKKIVVKIKYSYFNLNFSKYYNYSFEDKIISRIQNKTSSSFSINYFIIKRYKSYVEFRLPEYLNSSNKNKIDKNFLKISLNEYNKLKIKINK